MSKNNRKVDIVDSLAEITSYQNRDLLEQSLVKTIYELFPSADQRLFSIDQHEDSITIHLISKMGNDNQLSAVHVDYENRQKAALRLMFEKVINSGKAEYFENSDESLFESFYPVLDANNRVFAVLQSTSRVKQLKEEPLFTGILKVYSNYVNLLDKSQKDKLTGLFNRETLDQKILTILREPHKPLKQEALFSSLNKENRNKQSMKTFLAVIDIDHFKSINDRFGHLYGDEILVLVAQFMTKNFTRIDDLVYRYGGEEFVILINVDSNQQAQQAFERLRINIENHEFPQVGQVTVSIGYEEILGQSSSQEVIAAADSALYYAKQTGRNKTEYYQALVEQGVVKPSHIIESEDAILF
ncbi:GGDEF domain-containing protein [Brumicola nitratireducens]|uniref:diguanylate cyclase n=1 Tax=Glaciecola nitratireducens (strain JCM 12485 / KCTC 12276 / FR1064) TaxID=1085623 RepID=G4QIT9_GLANF|nr:GGDEF domain-containing protein [Glaciecola nitratireducens]AEP28278.1 GGDEF domain protein [Glaciecola nitratireducens FR1064]